MSSHVIVCNRFIPLSRGRRVVAGANPLCLWAKAGNTLDESPAHRRAPASNTIHKNITIKYHSQKLISVLPYEGFPV